MVVRVDEAGKERATGQVLAPSARVRREQRAVADRGDASLLDHDDLGRRTPGVHGEDATTDESVRASHLRCLRFLTGEPPAKSKLSRAPRRAAGGLNGAQRRPMLWCMRARRSPRRWSREVTERSNALGLEMDVFKLRSPRAMAESLRRSAERSRRRKAGPFQSAMSMLNFYINRAGRNLAPSRRRTLERAKGELGGSTAGSERRAPSRRLQHAHDVLERAHRLVLRSRPRQPGDQVLEPRIPIRLQLPPDLLHRL